MASSKTRVKGGKKLDAFLKKAKAAKSVKAVEMGYYAQDRYPDGQAVSNVALFNEFGTKHLPERPFMRLAIADMEGQVLEVLKREIDPRTMQVTYRTASNVGKVGRDAIEASAVRLDVKDTGYLSTHARWEVRQ